MLEAPQNAWFFYGSPESDMQLAKGVPGHGFKAASLSSPLPGRNASGLRAGVSKVVMAAGNLGPECGWDARLRRLPLRTRLRLDRETWKLTEERDELIYEARDLTRQEHLAALCEAIFGVCARLDVEGVRSTLTLSGGCDTRSLLVGLAHAGKKVTCVTWGLAASIHDPKNDAAIARDLARRFGMRHEYLPVPYTHLTLPTLYPV